MRYLIVTLALALAACGAPPMPAPTIDAGAPDVQPDTSPDAERLPDHCDDMVMGEHEAMNEAIDLDGEEVNPNECHLTRDCGEGTRLTHWCNTECPETNNCKPGGSWRHTEYKGGYAVVFVCGTSYGCPAN